MITGGFAICTPAKTQQFSYDSLNRLSSANTLGTNQPWWPGDQPLPSCWAEQYSYDPWGNLTSIAPSSSSLYTGCTQESGFSMLATTKNQLQDTNNDFVYDAAGNLIHPGPTGTYTYDAENHLTSAGGLAYLYDGDGKRVGKAPSSTPTQPNYLYWYGTGSQILEETDGAGNYAYLDAYFNGMLLARSEADNWVDHFFLDALGNVRAVYGDGDPDGGTSDYYPFGGERPITTGGVNVPFKFTGKERDPESGLDNFGARYNASMMGRFMSPDPLLNSGRPWDPQTWNRYAYTRNNPLNRVDPTGLFDWAPSHCKDNDDACRAKYAQYQQRFREALTKVRTARDRYDPKSGEYKRLDRILGTYGTENDHNNVYVGFSSDKNTITPADTSYAETEHRSVTVTFHMNLFDDLADRDPSGYQFAADVAHEGSHVIEGLWGQFDPPGLYMKFFASEKIAYENESFVDRAFNFGGSSAGVWNPSWANVDQSVAQYKAAIDSAAATSAQVDCRRRGGC